MSCLGGTPDEPRRWFRYQQGEAVPMDGRHCTRTHPFTSRRVCSSCPAFRGTRSDGTLATGLFPSGEPYGLRPDEHEAYQAAVDAALFDDDFSLVGLFEARMLEGIGDKTLLRIGDPDALARRAEYARKYRKQRGNAPDREATRERVRRLRARRKAAGNV